MGVSTERTSFPFDIRSRDSKHGCRPANRYIVFQVLPHTLGLDPEVWRVLDKCHSVRNLGEYDGDLNVDERLVAESRNIITASRIESKIRPPYQTSHRGGAFGPKIYRKWCRGGGTRADGHEHFGGLARHERR